MRRITLAVFLLFFVQAYAKNPPEALYNAKKAVLVNGGAPEKDYAKFRDKLQQWGRFEFVQDRSAADIVITLSSKEKNMTMERPGGGGVLSTIPVRVNYYRITNAADDSLLWTDETPGSSSDTEILVMDLQKKLKKKK